VNKSLLDTDILSEILKGINPTVARNAAAYRQAFGRYTLSSVTVMEVISGLQRNQSHRRIQKFLTDIGAEEALPFGQAEGKLAGEIDGDLERVGRPIGRCDPMIAAIAITNGLELVTGNTVHYQRIQQLGYPLTLVNRPSLAGPHGIAWKAMVITRPVEVLWRPYAVN
jgi:tRNA(fMet)-specific endonuclease VapC